MIDLKTKLIVSALIGAMFVIPHGGDWGYGNLALALFFLALVWFGR